MNFTSENNIDVLSLTETDFDDSRLAIDFRIDGFETYIQRTSGKVRTLLAVKNHLKATDMSKPTNLPTATISIKTKTKSSLIVSSVYRQWSTVDAMSELTDLREIISDSNNKNVVIMGDFNLDATKLYEKSYKHRKLADQLIEISEEFGLEPKFGAPTFAHQHGQSTLDFFLTSKETGGAVEVIPFGNSDHDAAVITLASPTEKNKLSKKQITIRGKIQNKIAFQSEMMSKMSEIVQGMLSTQDINQQASMFMSAFSSILDKHAPIRTIRVAVKKPKHALSTETLEARKERNKARNELMGASGMQRKIKMESFKKIRNRVNSLIKRDRAQKSEFDLRNGKNPFKVADCLLGKQGVNGSEIILVDGQRKITNNKEAAECMNDFFFQKVKELKNKVDRTIVKDPFKNLKEIKSKFKLQLASPDHIGQIIDKLRISNSCGLDGITSKTLKLVKNQVAPVLSLLVNTSFSTGVYPDQFKKAKIIPIFKNKGRKDDKSNYRPVSNLSTIGKVIEIAATIQITRYGERIGMFGDHQHGFRKGMSTTSALLSSLIKWQNSKEKGKFTGCLLYDLSAAYDTISPDILTGKAAKYGFDSLACSWLRSFTTGRSQCVMIGRSLSGVKQLNYGVPQGSPLSCVLFLMYVGDLPEWVKQGHLQGYADDTIHHVEANTEEEAIRKLEEEAKNILAFFASNELLANPTKTAFLMLRPTKSSPEKQAKVILNGTSIEESISERILGIQIQRDLRWDEQVCKVLSKVNYGLSILRQCCISN